VIKDISLRALPTLEAQFDAILIDDGHNWYTVYNEVAIIEASLLLATNGAIFFHDVTWPYGRRDMYYQPDLIPPEYRQPFLRSGIVRGCAGLTEGGSNSDLDNATTEGGPRNGVLTAIEDYIRDTCNMYGLYTLDQEHGLGIMVRVTDRCPRNRARKIIAARKRELRRAAVTARFPFVVALIKRILGRQR
jgi:hypothetical protein